MLPTGTLPIFNREIGKPAPGVPVTTDPNAPSNQSSENTGSYEEKVVRITNPNMSLMISAMC